jgi:hypothetical protein
MSQLQISKLWSLSSHLHLGLIITKCPSFRRINQFQKRRSFYSIRACLWSM